MAKKTAASGTTKTKKHSHSAPGSSKKKIPAVGVVEDKIPLKTPSGKVIITNEEITAKAEELSIKYKGEVTPMCFFDVGEKGSGDQIIGYVSSPPRIVKMRVMDTAVKSAMFAAEELLQSCLLKDESDPRIWSDAPECDNIHIGALIACSDMIKYLSNTYKKK